MRHGELQRQEPVDDEEHDGDPLPKAGSRSYESSLIRRNHRYGHCSGGLHPSHVLEAVMQWLQPDHFHQSPLVG